MDNYLWLLKRSERLSLGLPLAASLVLHAGLIAILATSTVFYPPTGSVERFNFIWVNTDSIPGEPSVSSTPSTRHENPEPPNRYEAAAPTESNAADDADTSAADDRSEPGLGKKLNPAALSVSEPVRKEPVDSQPGTTGLAEAKRLMQEKAERDRLAAEMARMQRLVAITDERILWSCSLLKLFDSRNEFNYLLNDQFLQLLPLFARCLGGIAPDAVRPVFPLVPDQNTDGERGEFSLSQTFYQMRVRVHYT